MEKLRIPIALVVAMSAQLAAGVWWVSQQAAIIADLEATVSQMSSRMAIETQVNLRRDVQLNAEHIESLSEDMVDNIDELWDDVDELWDTADSLADMLSRVTSLNQRIAVMENELKHINQDHEGVLDMKGGMK